MRYQLVRLDFSFCLILVIANLAISCSAYEDDKKFDIEWRGGNLKNLEHIDQLYHEHENLYFTTSDLKNKYVCNMPLPLPEDNDTDADTENTKYIDTAGLFNEIYSKKFCSYRIESYWIYELCHGQYVKQYHEAKNTGKRSVTDSYFLGNFDKSLQEPDYINGAPNIHWRMLDGIRVATYGVKYTDGTACEVIPGRLREIHIFYACVPNGNDNIATFEEVSSCLYEMVIVSKSICGHPAYVTPSKYPQRIDCFSMEGSLVKPEELDNNEAQQEDPHSAGAQVKLTDNDGKEFVVQYVKNEELPANNVHPQEIISIKDAKEDDEITIGSQTVLKQQSIIDTSEGPQQVTRNVRVSATEAEEKAIIAAFLNGDSCLTGGEGWWKFEICYGKHVMQFHEDESSKDRVSTVLLGTWSKDNHWDWIQKHAHKKPSKNKDERWAVSLNYSNGLTCEGVNKKRFVEVRLMCPKPSANVHAVSIFLIEPLTCEYLLGIESPWFCDLIKNAGADGIPDIIKN